MPFDPAETIRQARSMGFLTEEQMREVRSRLECTLAESGLLSPEQIARIRDAALPAETSASPSPSVGTTLGVEPAIDLDRQRGPLPVDGPKFATLEMLGEGGMGEVRLAVDRDLRREVAIKRVRSPARPGPLRRFVEEAQVTGQLEHPHIVPVYELGLDPEDRAPYLVLRRIRGKSLSEVLGEVRAGRKTGLGPTAEGVEPPARALSRLLDVFRKLASGVAYAHSRRVIHRDLKPENVMTGEFGQVLVMDWGLARVLGATGAGTAPGGREPIAPSDSSLRPSTAYAPLQGGSAPLGPPGCAFRAPGGEPLPPGPPLVAGFAGDSPRLTREGQVLGTPRYMSPEQALGRTLALDERSDIFSLGAILYEIVSLVPAIEGASVAAVLLRAADGVVRPPSDRSVAPWSVPREIEAVVLKAMAFRPEDRYRSVPDLIEDVEAYLEGRTLSAVRYSPLQLAAKWVRRNRAVSAVSGVAAVLVLFFIGWLIAALGRARAGEQLAQERENQVFQEKDRVEEEKARADRSLEDVLRLSDFSRVEDLEERLEEDWRGFPVDVDPFERWLAQAKSVTASLAYHREELGKARERGRRAGDSWEFDRIEEQWLHDHRESLVLRLEGLAKPIREVEDALLRARRLRDRTAGADREAWDGARAEGLEIEPVPGLVPLGRDPGSGLWEFYCVETGERPERGSDGTVRPTPETAIVLVRIPGGRFRMGSNSGKPWEGPAHDVTVPSFLLSKYEMTQAQWQRATGENPSYFSDSPPPSRPVERVSWTDCRHALVRLGLRLPSEAEWEFAARAGTTSLWWTGDDPLALAEAGNLNDLSGGRAGLEAGEAWDDGHGSPAPVGSFRPNPFGLHDTIGNVWEWCEDTHQEDYAGAPADGGSWIVEGATERVVRGGAYADMSGPSRSSARYGDPYELRDDRLGVRPAMDLP